MVSESETTHDKESDVQKLARMIKGIRIAMLTTASVDGTLRSRPMATQKTDFDGTLWFFTDADSPKVDEVRDDQQVNVGYADPDSNRYVSISGAARVVRDRAKIKELWSPLHKAWFPNGPDDPNIALLKVEVTQAEYWDGPSNTFVQLAGFLKATLTGKRYHPGENEKLDLAAKG